MEEAGVEVEATVWVGAGAGVEGERAWYSSSARPERKLGQEPAIGRERDREEGDRDQENKS